MKNFFYPGNAGSFLQKGITLSLFILLNFAARANPAENRERKTGADFISEKPFPSFEHYFKNNPTEAAHATRTAAYSPEANSPKERREAVSMNGNTHKVIAAGAACSYTLNPPEKNIGPEASTETTKGLFPVTVQGTGCSWTPATTDNWITNVTKAANPKGTWNVTYSFTENTSTSERRRSITVADKTHTVIQAKAEPPTCTISLPPAGAGVPSTTGKGNVQVSTSSPECGWTPVVTVEEGDAWLFITGAEGSRTGTQTLSYAYTANPNWAERTATITVAGQTYRVTQVQRPYEVQAYCTEGLRTTVARVGAQASDEEFLLSTGTEDCAWSAFTPDDWITNIVQPNRPSDGFWNVTYHCAANTSPAERKGRIFVNDLVYTVIQAGSTEACSYTLATDTGLGQSGAGSASVSVSTNRTDCTWTAAAAPEASWITITPGQNLVGSKAVNYTFTANTATAPRMGTITVAGHTYTLTQAGTAATSCTYTLSAYEARIGAAASATGTTKSFSVTVQGTHCTWAATTTAEWITGITKTASATANDSWNISYSWLENTSTAERGGTISVGDKNYSVIQAGAACSVVLTDYNQYVPATAGEKTVFVSAADNCDWTAIVTQGEDWLTIKPGQTFRGKKDLAYSYTANPDNLPRTGTINVAGKLLKIEQYQGPCKISLPSNPGRVPATAGEGRISVQANGDTCGWTAEVTEGATWLSINPGQQNLYGTKNLSYSYRANPNASQRTGTITVDGNTYTVKQAGTAAQPGCWYTLNPPEKNIGPEASTTEVKGKFSVTVEGTGCSWTPTTTADWITNITKTAGEGSWEVSYSYTANTSASERRGTIAVADQTYTLIQAAAIPCTYTLNPPEKNIGPEASTTGVKEKFSVTVQGTACAWTPTTTADWITDISKTAGDGSWEVSYSYTANTSASERRGIITVGNKTHTLIQAAAIPCTYTLNPSEKNIGPAASTAGVKEKFSVTVQGTACAWTPTTTADWITDISKTAGDGSWEVSYSYTANTSASERRGIITVGNKTHTLIQAAAIPCTYTLNPSEKNIGPEASTETAKGLFTVTVQGTGCSWTVTTTADWITNITKAANPNGTWNVSYSYTANTSASERRGIIKVADKSHTVIQAGTCLFSLSSTTADVPATAGKGTVEIVAAAGCQWTAAVNPEAAAWLTVAEGENRGTGRKTINYSYTANPSPAVRKGTITVAGQTLTVTQSAPVTGVETISHVNIFPNPAKDFVTVDLSAKEIKCVSLKMVNQAGQTLYKVDNPPAQALQIPLHGFSGGLYFIFLRGEDKVWVNKLIVR